MEQALHEFRQFLRRRSLRASGVREQIVRLILSRKGHFDVDELVAELQRKGVQASRATVYRTLPLLREAGLVQSVVAADERRRYEAARSGRDHHDHLVCTSCGRVVEFQFEAFEILQRELASRHGFRLVSHSHELFGVCPACQGEEPSAPAPAPSKMRRSLKTRGRA